MVLPGALARFNREAKRAVCNTGRYRMPYFVWGQGPPLVFVHGVCDANLSFIQPLARLSANFRYIAYDLPGSPGNRSALRPVTPDDLAVGLSPSLEHPGVEAT